MASMAAALVGVRAWRSRYIPEQAAPVEARAPATEPARARPPALAVETPTEGAPPLVVEEPSPPWRPTEVIGFDFEDGALPPSFIDGHVVAGACAPGSQFCALGTLSPYDASRNSVTVQRIKPALFEIGAGQVLSFDYWAGADASSIRIQLWVPSRRENFALVLRELVRERWAHVELRLGDLRGHRWKRALTAGDGVGNIMITAGRMGGAPFYVDNLKVVAYSPEAALPATSASRSLAR
jgi:hypothetical protein